MLGMLLAHILDPKVVDDKGEADGAGFVFEETWCVGNFIITMWGETLFQKFAKIPACGRPYIPRIIFM